MAYHIINSDLGHTCSKQQLDKTWKITFDSLFRKSDERERKKKTRMTIAKLFAFYANANIQLLDDLYQCRSSLKLESSYFLFFLEKKNQKLET